MSWPSVSIGIPTFNRHSEVLRAITSVLRQDYEGPIEIVVVDDGSTDGTILPVDVKLVRHETNLGIAASKNHALLAASGELRGILDSDDTYERSFVRKCVAELQRNPDVGLVYTDNYAADPRGRRIRIDRAIEWDLNSWLKTCNLRGDCWLARWEILKQTQLHDERFRLEVDGDLFYQLAEITTFLRIPVPLQTVTEHRGRTSRSSHEAAYWHAAGLGKYGHSIQFAFDRAKRGRAGEIWTQAIQDGYAFGKSLRKVEKIA